MSKRAVMAGNADPGLIDSFHARVPKNGPTRTLERSFNPTTRNLQQLPSVDCLLRFRDQITLAAYIMIETSGR